MSRNSKIEFLFDHQFRGLKSLRKRCAKTLLLEDVNVEKIAERIFEFLNTSGTPGIFRYNIVRSLKELDLFEEGMLDGRYIKSAATVLLWLNAAINYRQMLNDLSDAELEARFDEIRAEQIRAEVAVDEEEFFNHHDADADFDYWLEMACWKPEEAVALSMGKDPKVVNRETLNKELEERINQTATASESVFFREYLKRCEQVARAQEIDVLPKNITPSASIKWATAQKMRLDDGLNKRTKGLLARPIQTDDDEDGLSTKSQNAIYKILCGLAVCYYDHPHDLAIDEKSKTYKRMADDLAEAGIMITDRTIKKHLRAASEYTRSQEVKIKVPKRLWRSREA
jgi:hypothetical protein